jgi:hypothetical protein
MKNTHEKPSAVSITGRRVGLISHAPRCNKGAISIFFFHFIYGQNIDFGDLQSYLYLDRPDGPKIKISHALSAGLVLASSSSSFNNESPAP